MVRVLVLVLLLAARAWAGQVTEEGCKRFYVDAVPDNDGVTFWARACDRAILRATSGDVYQPDTARPFNGWTIGGAQTPVCGDGNVDIALGEDCDVGNQGSCIDLPSCQLPGEPGTTSANQCKCETPTNVCGNGMIEAPQETCDCGGSLTSCTPPTGGQCSGVANPSCQQCSCVEVTSPPPTCGNGSIETPEICDPGGQACPTGNNNQCGQQGICTALFCDPSNGPCTSGCRPDCSGCISANTGCPIGTTRYVDPNGTDTATGANDNLDPMTGAWRTIGKALSSTGATISDIVCIKGGTYQEHALNVVLQANPANEGQRIRFVGISDANGAKLSIIDGKRNEGGGGWVSDPTRCATCWQKDINYTGNATNGVPHHGTYCDATGNCGYVVRYDNSDWATALASGPSTNSACCCCGGKTNNWNAADVIYTVQGGTTRLRFAPPANTNPNTLASGRLGFTAKESTINTNGRDYLTFENLEFRNSYTGIDLGDGSTDIWIQDNSFSNHYLGVRVGGGTVTRPIIRRNKATLNYHKAFSNLSGLGLITHKASDPKHWSVWQIMKAGHDSDPTFFGTPAGDIVGPVLIEDNEIRDHYQFFSHSDGDYSCPTSETACQIIRRNVCTNLIDDCMDWQRAVGTKLQAYDNRSLDANYGLRVGLMSNSGPAYFYRNQIYTPETGNLAEAGGVYFFRGTTASQFLYNNSFLVKLGMAMAGKEVQCDGPGSAEPSACTVGSVDDTWAGYGLPNTRMANNIISGSNSSTTWTEYPNVFGNSGTPKPVWDFNWSTRGRPSWAVAASNISSQNRSLWPINIVPNFEPPAGTGTTDPRNHGDDVLTTTGCCPTQPWPWVPDGRPYDPTGGGIDMGALQYVVAGVTTTTSTSSSTAPGATTTTTTLPDVGQRAADWTGSACVYRFDEVPVTGQSSPRAAIGACGSDNPSCNMAEENGIDLAKDTTNFQEGTGSVFFDTALDRLVNSPKCAYTNQPGSATFMCWLRPTKGNTSTRIFWKLSDDAVNGYRLGLNTSNQFECSIGDGTDRVISARAGTGGAPAPNQNTWVHMACVTDAATDLISIYDNGSFLSPAQTQQDMAANISNSACAGPGNPQACCTSAGNGTCQSTSQFGLNQTTGFEGQLDECVRVNQALPADRICRIAACGIAGERCTCSSVNPILYKSCTTDADCQSCPGCSAIAECEGGTCRGRAETGPLGTNCALPNCSLTTP